MDLDEPLEPLSHLLGLPASETSLVARYSELASCIQRAAGQQVLSSLPLSADTSEQYSERYLDVIQDRLQSLGYLPYTVNDIRRGKPGPQLQAGILAFQQGAGLLGDGWVGRKTWQALQQLVSFEEELNINIWLDPQGRPTIVLQRAIQLRLFALGCASKKPGQQLEPESLALKRFVSIAKQLHLMAEDTDSDSLECIALLLDQNRLVAELGQVVLVENARLSGDVKYFLLSVARIELWLLGYSGVRPDGAREEVHTRQIRRDRGAGHRLSTTIPLIRSGNKIARRSHFHRALCDYYEISNLSSEKSSTKSLADHYLRNFPDFFRSLDDGVEVDENRVTEKLIDFIAEDGGNIRRLESEVQSLGSRLFDGIKRIGRLILRAIGFVFNQTARLLKLLARPFHRMVSQTFQSIKIAIAAVSDGVGLLTGKVCKAPQSNKAWGQFNADGDLTVLIADINSTNVEAFSDHLRYRSKAFFLACSLVNRFLNILASILSGVLKGALTGWWALIRTCLHIYHSYLSIMTTLDELYDLTSTQTVTPPQSYNPTFHNPQSIK